jgi:hypothetical protein
MAGFRDAVDVCGVQDLGYKGVPWTYEKKVVGGSFCRTRLDRALASLSWSSSFPKATVQHLATVVTSDHLPLLLRYAKGRRTGQPKEKVFRYEVMLENHEKFEEMLAQEWSTMGKGNSVCEMHKKLGHVSEKGVRWDVEVFNNVKNQI